MLGLGVAIFLAIRSLGETLEAPHVTALPARAAVSKGEVDVVFHVLATLSAVIAVGYLIGRAFRWLGQPPVIGEVIAGLVLGPSVLGALSPQIAHLLVPAPDIDPSGTVTGALRAISQLGVVLYMFLVGLELNGPRMRKQAQAAVAISHASILLPFLLGAGLSLWLYPLLSSAEVSFTSFALFMGVAMAITAFPVLARILTDKKLDKTELGSLALGCAATGDVTAWCLLALVIGVAQAQVGNAVQVLLATIAFIAVMFTVVGPIATRVARRLDQGEFPSWTIPGVLVAVMVSALATETIGIHSVFGGFLLGAVIPHDSRLAGELHRKLHDVATILLLPAFFAVTGLQTEISLLGQGGDWLAVGAIILVATVGKVGGTFAAARFTGMDWRSASALGMLMNTRGLMELIVLNIGLEMGIISPTLFAMMVLMALATTLSTAPALRWLIPEARA